MAGPEVFNGNGNYYFQCNMAGPLISFQWQRKLILLMFMAGPFISIQWQRKLILPMLHGSSLNKYLMATETNIANVTWLVP